MAIGVKHPLLMRVCLHAFHVTDVQQVQCSGIAPNSTVVNVLYIKCDVPFVGCIDCIYKYRSVFYQATSPRVFCDCIPPEEGLSTRPKRRIIYM